MTDEFPSASPSQRLWLMTLADLALLLVGFLLLVQVTERNQHGALSAGLRASFGGSPHAPPPPSLPSPQPVAAAGMVFASGSAVPPVSTTGLAAWAHEAVRDPRVTLTVTGSVDGSPADRDAATGSAAILAADRARAAAVALAGVVPADRLVITTGRRPGQRAALVTLAFAGETH